MFGNFVLFKVGYMCNLLGMCIRFRKKNHMLNQITLLWRTLNKTKSLWSTQNWSEADGCLRRSDWQLWDVPEVNSSWINAANGCIFASNQCDSWEETTKMGEHCPGHFLYPVWVLFFRVNVCRSSYASSQYVPSSYPFLPIQCPCVHAHMSIHFYFRIIFPLRVC